MPSENMGKLKKDSPNLGPIFLFYEAIHKKKNVHFFQSCGQQ